MKKTKSANSSRAKFPSHHIDQKKQGPKKQKSTREAKNKLIPKREQDKLPRKKSLTPILIEAIDEAHSGNRAEGLPPEHILREMQKNVENLKRLYQAQQKKYSRSRLCRSATGNQSTNQQYQSEKNSKETSKKRDSNNQSIGHSRQIKKDFSKKPKVAIISVASKTEAKKQLFKKREQNPKKNSQDAHDKLQGQKYRQGLISLFQFYKKKIDCEIKQKASHRNSSRASSIKSSSANNTMQSKANNGHSKVKGSSKLNGSSKNMAKSALSTPQSQQMPKSCQKPNSSTKMPGSSSKICSSRQLYEINEFQGRLQSSYAHLSGIPVPKTGENHQNINNNPKPIVEAESPNFDFENLPDIHVSLFDKNMPILQEVSKEQMSSEFSVPTQIQQFKSVGNDDSLKGFEIEKVPGDELSNFELVSVSL